MEIKTKFVVLQDEYANWIITQAKNTYLSLANDEKKYNELDHLINTTFKKDTFVRSQNDFKLQTIMAFYNNEPIASLELNKSPKKRDFLKSTEKPLFISKIFYTEELGLNAILEKVKIIASQKSYYPIFGEILADRIEAVQSIQKNGFKIRSNGSFIEEEVLPTVVFKLTEFSH